MKVSDLFHVKYGINMELNACEIATDDDCINFVARTSENNGVVAKVKPVDGKIPQKAGIVTCAGSGSVLSAFVQKKPFYSGRDLYILIPREQMTLEVKLFYCMCIKMNAYRYQYGRQANKTLKDIELPETPDWLREYKINYKPIQTIVNKKALPINTKYWEKFKIQNVFEKIKRGQRLKSEDRLPGLVRYFSASDTNNGMTDLISNPLFLERNSLIYTTFGDCFYVEGEFTASDEINIFQHPKMNKFNGLFIATVINKNKYKFKFGRKAFQNKFEDEIIKLPVNMEGEIDWVYMANYIKALPYSDKL